MKRLAILFAIMALLLVSAVASADPLPSGAVEVEHWEWVPGSAGQAGYWKYFADGDTSALARAWRSGPDSGFCNRAEWIIDFTNHASVAQWAEWTIGGTRWDWRVLKPGEYAADCIEFTLKSNNSILIDYEGFADLERLNTPENVEEFGAGVLQYIETYYSFGESITSAVNNGWVRAEELNDDDDTIPDSAALHAGLSTKLFNRIIVADCNSSGEYEDTATITLSLLNQQDWVDDEGGWVSPQV
jgi:hypothetical protein